MVCLKFKQNLLSRFKTTQEIVKSNQLLDLAFLSFLTFTLVANFRAQNVRLVEAIITNKFDVFHVIAVSFDIDFCVVGLKVSIVSLNCRFSKNKIPFNVFVKTNKEIINYSRMYYC